MKNFLDRAATQLFKALLPSIEDTPANRESLTLMCQAWSDWKNAIAVLNKEGRVIETKTGVKSHPMNNIAKQNYEQFLKLADALALTPKSKKQKQAEIDDLDKLMGNDG